MAWKLLGIFIYGCFTSAAGAAYVASKIVAGNMTVCAILEASTLKCWGAADSQRLPQQYGDDSGEMGVDLPSIDLGLEVDTVAVSSHICAVLSDATLKCWGKNEDGQCGAGHADDLPVSSAVTVDLGTGRTAVDVATGISHTCAILDDATLKCWGSNAYGQLGRQNTQPIGSDTGQMGDSLTAIDLGTGRTAVQVVAGSGFTCALLDDGNVKCWGYNNYGQLGMGISDQSWGGAADQMGDYLTAVSLGTGRTAKQISANRFHVCAILDDDSAKCWGYNDQGQLGQGHKNWIGTSASQMGDDLDPIYLGQTATHISAGKSHTCAVLLDSSLKCWGGNNGGQLGLEDQTERGGGSSTDMINLPTVDLGTDLTADEVSCTFGDVTCVLLNDQSVKCWGRNTNGQLGQGDTNTRGSAADQMGDFLLAVDLESAEVTSSSTSTSSISASSTSSLSSTSTRTATATSSTTGTVTSSTTRTTTVSTTGTTTDSTTGTTTGSTTGTTTDSTTGTMTGSATGTTTGSMTGSTTGSTTGTSSSSSTTTATVSTTGDGGTSSSTTMTSSSHTATSPAASATSTSTTSSTSSGTEFSGVTSYTETSTKTLSFATFTSSSDPVGTLNSTSIVSIFTSSSSTFTSTSHPLGTSTSTSNFTTASDPLETLNSTSIASIFTSASSSFTSTSTVPLQSDATVSSAPSTVPPVEISVKEFEALEEERKAEAAQAVQELETAETAAVSQLLTEIQLDTESSTGILGQGSKDTGGGVMTMVAVSPEAVVESQQSVTITGESGQTSADVPPEVVQLASQLAAAAGGSGMILLTMTEVSNDVADKIRNDDARINMEAQPGRRLASSLKTLPINMKIRASEGEELRISNLTTAITFTLSVENDSAEVPSCAFWDEELAIWSTEGVTTLPSTIPGQVVCSTTHLSIFGGIFEVLVGDIAQVLRCSTAGMVFSSEGLGNLFKNEWMLQSPSLIFFSLLFLFLLSFFGSWYLDVRVRRYFPDKEKESVFWPLKEEEDEEHPEIEQGDNKEKRKCCSRGCKGSMESGCEWFLWCVGLLFGYENLAEVVKELLPNAAVGVVDRCITQLHAHKTGTTRDSIHAVADISKVLTHDERMESSQPEHSVQAKRQSLTEIEIKTQLSWAVDTFLSSSWFTRLRLLFPAVHPWVDNTRISFFTSHTIRTTLIIMKLISAAATAALFFSSSAQTPDSDPDCEPPEDMLREMIQTATVGLLTAFLGDAVIFFLFLVQLRQPKPEVEWTEELKEKYRKRWRCKSVVFWTVSTIHLGTCLLYCLSFLANVTESDVAEWLESCAVTLLQDLIILPLLMALVLASLATLAVLCSRKVQRSYWIPEDDKKMLSYKTYVSFDGILDEEKLRAAGASATSQEEDGGASAVKQEGNTPRSGNSSESAESVVEEGFI